MFNYGALAETPDRTPIRAPVAQPDQIGQVFQVVRRHSALVGGAAVAGALLAYAGAQSMPPRYVATAEIYLDPGGAQGGETQPIAIGQDSTGFVNYVESQSVIVTSRSVLERAVRAAGLDHDSEFVGSGVSNMVGALMGNRVGGAEDSVSAAARTLGAAVKVTRPERTFVLQVSVTGSSPERAAELANATARAYIDETGAIRADAARQSAAEIAKHLETLRGRVVTAEKAVEDFKIANNLTGTPPGTLIESQLKELTDQIVAARTRMNDAMERAQQVDAARHGTGDIGAFASQFGIATLAPLRAQEADARQKLADARAELGPRHPQVLDAEARLTAASAAVDAELARFAQSQRLEYQRAKTMEASLQKRIEDMRSQTNSDGEALVQMRDLERKAAAARGVYEIFVNKSRDTGEIREVEPVRTKLISEASPPKNRSFPPSALTLAGVGGLAGFITGVALAMWRDANANAPLPAPVQPGPQTNPDRSSASRRRDVESRVKRFLVDASTLSTQSRRQSFDRLDVTRMGIPISDDLPGAFGDALEAAGYVEASGRRRAFAIVAVGPNEAGQRTALALNLALAAVADGGRVALLDAAGRHSRLTRALRLVTRTTTLPEGPFFETDNGVWLVLPKTDGGRRGRAEIIDVLDLTLGEDLDLVICDGPDVRDSIAEEIFVRAEAIISLDDDDARKSLAKLGFSADAEVRLDLAESEFSARRGASA